MNQNNNEIIWLNKGEDDFIFPDGIEIYIINDGNKIDYGENGDILYIHYNTYIKENNNLVESSRDLLDGVPFTIQLGNLFYLSGFELILKHISLGCQIKALLTSEWAYGEDGLIPVIPPNTDLIFDIELISINKNNDI